jgi:hypothetical protein
MLYAFGFERVGVVVGDLYFTDPDPIPGQEGAERGVRLEVRLFDRPPLHGSIYSAQPITVGTPIWRADLLETVAGPPASWDRTHHHPNFRGWEPGRRNFDRNILPDPVGWVGERLCDVDGLVASSDVDPSALAPGDADALRQAVPEILDVVRRLLDRVRAGETPIAPAGVAGDGTGSGVGAGNGTEAGDGAASEARLAGPVRSGWL